MPLSIFLGRPSPDIGESLWTDNDQDTAVGYMRWLEVDRAERCSRCGTKESDWKGPDPETGELRELRDPAYKVTVRYCRFCDETDEANDDLSADGEKRAGRSVVLVPNLCDDERDASDDDR